MATKTKKKSKGVKVGGKTLYGAAAAAHKAAQKRGPKQKATTIGAGFSYRPRKAKASKIRALKVGSYAGVTGAGVVHHNGYSYVNKKTGKTVHVAPHSERPRMK